VRISGFTNAICVVAIWGCAKIAESTRRCMGMGWCICRRNIRMECLRGGYAMHVRRESNEDGLVGCTA